MVPDAWTLSPINDRVIKIELQILNQVKQMNRLSNTFFLALIFFPPCLFPDAVYAQGSEGEFVLKNSFVSAHIRTKGAELVSLRGLGDGTEYIWQGDATYWAGQAPLLFPIIGSLKDGEYLHDGKKYSMPQHGFARNRYFKIVSVDDTTASLSLVSDAESLDVYPFEFELRVNYLLVDKSLAIEYQVFNRDTSALFFSIGGHPGFNCPLKEGERRSDYALVFDKKETLALHLKPGKLRSGEMRPFLKEEDRIVLAEDLFEEGALIFSGLLSDAIHLVRGAEPILTLTFVGFPNLGIWSPPAKDSPFVCIEPWFGLTDPEYTDQRLETKEGIVALPVGQNFISRYIIELHN